MQLYLKPPLFKCFGRTTNATDSYRLVAKEKANLAVQLKQTNDMVKRLQSKLANANKNQQSVQDMRRNMHDAESRATSLEKLVDELSVANQRALER